MRQDRTYTTFFDIGGRAEEEIVVDTDREVNFSGGVASYDFRGLWREAGFALEECEYAMVELENRKNEKVMRRCFVHILARAVRD